MPAPAVVDTRYEILEEAGRGACAVVYRARDVTSGQLVALKTLEPGRVHAPSAVDRLAQEAEVMARIEHPHAMPVFDFGWFRDGRPWFVTELLGGEGLDTRLARGPLPPLLVIRLLRQVCDVLAATHAQGYLHGDVKPGNLWIQSVWEGLNGPMPIVRLIDFGLALSLQAAHAGRRPAAGSPNYMAPEVVAGAPADGRADLYGLGMVAYEALAGVHPYETEGPARRALRSRLTGQPPPLVFVAPGVDPALAAVVDALLARDPAERPASACALDDRLAELEARRVAERVAQRVPHASRPPRSRPLALVRQAG
ncbi:MAG: serine/threonine protein kinase [Myxococcales bacterium]|nr:serine/threonine protein kinase [Myxococcales bacterium]